MKNKILNIIKKSLKFSIEKDLNYSHIILNKNNTKLLYNELIKKENYEKQIEKYKAYVEFLEDKVYQQESIIDDLENSINELLESEE